MANKNTQFRFAVASANGVSTNVVITVSGQLFWEGALNQTSSWVDPTTPDEECTSIATGVIDLPTVTLNTMPTKSNLAVTISCSGGTVLLGGVHQQNNPVWGPWPGNAEVQVCVSGTTDYTDAYDISTQPEWNGQVFLNRYTLADNYGITGPGAVIIESGESCEFTLECYNYCPIA